MGSTSRAGRWGLATTAEYLATGDQIVRAIQLEDRSAFDELDAILDTPGLTAVFLGMGDLSLSSGLRRRAAPSCRASPIASWPRRPPASLPCGTAVGDAGAAVAAAARRGFSFVMVSNDATIFGRAAAELGAAVTRRAPRRARARAPWADG